MPSSPSQMMRRAASQYTVAAHVLNARQKLGSFAHLYLAGFLLGVFALTAFFSTPYHSDLARPHTLIDADPLRATATASHAAAAKAAAAQAQAAASEVLEVTSGPPASCHSEPGAEYAGEDVIVWGDQNPKDTAAACCESCQAAAGRGCNVWVWCGNPGGCGTRSYRECWLKRQRHMDTNNIAGQRGTNFTSGALYSEAEHDAAAAAEKARLQALRDNEELPLVYLDVSIQGQAVGRITFVLFTKEAPRAAENFRQLCTGEKGIVPPGKEGAGKPYHFKGKPFYRIIDAFIDQSGAETESVFGGMFKDDPGGLRLKHDRKGLLSMANTGPDTNTSHFSIMVAPAPHLNGHYTIFGEAVDGFEVIDAINALAKGKKDNTATAAEGALITDAGQLRKGTYTPDLAQM